MIQGAATRTAVILAFAAMVAACRPDGGSDQSRWLRVEGRFIVDAAGHPFRLVGMGRYQPEAGIANKLVGSLDEICLHYQQLGMNALRVAVGGRNDWLPDCDVTPYGGFDGYVERFLDWLELERVNLVMHDWGAAALAFAERVPQRVERIVLINALPLFDGYSWHRLARIWRMPVLGELWMGALTPRMLRRTLRGANATALPEHELQEIYRQLDFGTQRAILKLYRSVKPGTLAAAGERLGEIDSPALIVWGERDPYIPSRAAAQYAGALGGESELALLADAGHWPWLDRPDVVDTVARFLARN